MTGPYEEILAGEAWLRSPPNRRHEEVCLRLHELVADCVGARPALLLLEPRSLVEVRTGTMVRPDLSLVQASTGRLVLAAEVINAGDHRTDTVVKKAVYEEVRLPRLWIADPRYDNVEIYETAELGLVLRRILAGAEALTDPLLPGFGVSMNQLFAAR